MSGVTSNAHIVKAKLINGAPLDAEDRADLVAIIEEFERLAYGRPAPSIPVKAITARIDYASPLERLEAKVTELDRVIDRLIVAFNKHGHGDPYAGGRLLGRFTR